MLTRKTLQNIFHAVAFCLWPITTYATSVTLGKTFSSIPPLAWVVVLVLAAVSGAVSLLDYLKKEMMTPEGEAAVKRAWRWILISHEIGAIFIGLIAFLCAEALDLPDFWEAIVIALMAYGGARVTSRLADGVTDGLINRFMTIVGGTPPAPPAPPPTVTVIIDKKV
jgi:hypothetical protein